MAPNRLPWSVRASAGKRSSLARATSLSSWAAPSRRLYSEWTCRWTKSEWVIALPAAVRRGKRDLDKRGRARPHHELGELAVPAGQVLLLDERLGQRSRHLGVVGGLRLALDPERLGHALGLLPGGVPLPLGGSGGDLRLALGLDQLVALLLGLLLLDLLGLDVALVRRVKADIGQRHLFHLDPVLGQPLGELLLDIRLDGRSFLQDLRGIVERTVRLEDFLGGGIHDDVGVADSHPLVDLGGFLGEEAEVEDHLHVDGQDDLAHRASCLMDSTNPRTSSRERETSSTVSEGGFIIGYRSVM